MTRQKARWAVVAILAAPLGGVLGRFHLITPSPAAFFALGVLATLSIGGVVYGIREGQRAAAAGRLIRN